MWIFYLVLACSGLLLFLQGPTIPLLMQSFGIDEKLAGLLPFAFFLGNTLGTAFFPSLAVRLGSRGTIAAGVAAAVAGLSAAAASGGLALALPGFAFFGAACGIFSALPGTILTQVYGSAASRHVNRYYSMFAFTAPVAPPLIGRLADAGVSWRWVFAGAAAVMLILLPLLKVVRLENLHRAERGGLIVLRETLTAAPRLLFGLMLMIFFYIAAESSLNSWAVKFSLAVFPGTSQTLAGFGVSCFWVGIFCGRLISSAALRRFSALNWLLILCSGAAAAVLAASAAGGSYAAVALLAVCGLFLSGIWPTLISYVERFPRNVAGTAMSLLLIGGGFGGMIFPYLVGVAAAAGGYRIGIRLIALFPALVVLLLLSLRPDRAPVKG